MKNRSLLGAVMIAAALSSTPAIADDHVAGTQAEVVKSQKVGFKAAHDVYSMIDIKGRGVSNVDVDASKCKINAERSKKVGKVVFKPLSEEPFVMFVMDDRGDTYTVRIEPSKSLAPELFTIVNKTAEARKKEVISAQNRYQESTVKALEMTQSREKLILDLVKAMASNSHPENADIEELNRTVPLWQEVSLVETKNYHTGVVTGKTYRLKNVSNAQMVLAEQEFYTLNENTLAVSIEKPTLEQGEVTLLHLVTANQ